MSRSATHSLFMTSRVVRNQASVPSHSEGRLKVERSASTKERRSRVMHSVMAAALAAGDMTAAATVPAAAAPARAQACYDHSVGYETFEYGELYKWPRTGWATTSPYCADTNIKANVMTDVKVCFRATGRCNGFKTAYARSWTEAATNVLDGTQYRLLFSSYSAGPASA